MPQSIEISSCGHDLCEERINGGQMKIVGTPLPAGIAGFHPSKKISGGQREDNFVEQ
jgi:hypothetical protein